MIQFYSVKKHMQLIFSVKNGLEYISKVMLPMTKLTLSCSKQAPTERMSIRDAAAQICIYRIRDLHVRTRQMEEVTVYE